MGSIPETVRIGFIQKFIGFWSKERSILLLVFVAACVIRSIPGWMNAAWGSDFGIYYGITKDFAENPELFRPYSGWGVSYNYFPVLYVIVAALHFITGAEIVWLLPRVTPIFGGLSVLVFYFVVKEIVNDKRLALLCCAFLATNPFHIYQTSHAAPMTMGHFFMALCLYFFIKKEKTNVSVGALYLCSILLIMSHHLTTFFYIITIVFITFYRNLISQSWTKDLRSDIFYILAFSALTFFYWLIIATSVFRSFILGDLLLPAWLVIALFYIGLFVLLGLVVIKRRLGIFQGEEKKWKMGFFQSMIITIVICSIFVLTFSFIKIPNTKFILKTTAILILLPFIVTVGFGVYGGFVLKGKRERGYTLGWLYPISISLILTTLTWHQTLFPFRHLEYIAYPFSILSGIGVYTYWKVLKEKEKSSPSRKMNSSRMLTYFVVAILTLSLISAYSVQRATSRYEESISQEVFDVVYWIQENVSGYNFTVASDHRISQILWAEGYNVTSDDAYLIWFSPNWTGCLEELETVNYSKPRIRYILIDHVMRFDGVQSNINETPKNLTLESYGKFSEPPFSMIHRSENEDGTKWAELYEVDWEYIEENRP